MILKYLVLWGTESDLYRTEKYSTDLTNTLQKNDMN